MSTALLTDFSTFELQNNLLTALNQLGLEAPTQLQSLIFPHFKAGQDLIIDAPPGTGKTLAFSLAALNGIDQDNPATQTLILAPTRALVIAINTLLRSLAGTHISCVALYGGQAQSLQVRQLAAGAQVVVGTPSRVLDMVESGTLSLSALKLIVFNEADEMVRLNFLDDVESILDYVPRQRQIAIFTASLAPRLQDIVDEQLRQPLRLSLPTLSLPSQGFEFIQAYWPAPGGEQKLSALIQLIEKEDSFSNAIIFTNTRHTAQALNASLMARGYNTAACFSGMTIKARKAALAAFAAQKLDFLVCTPTFIQHLAEVKAPLIFNYDIPSDVNHYSARTGLLAEKGRIINFVETRQIRQLRTIERASHQAMHALNLSIEDAQVDKGVAQLKQWALDAIERESLGFYLEIINELENEHDLDVHEIAAAFANLAQRLRTSSNSEPPARTAPQRNSRFNENTHRPGGHPKTQRYERPDVYPGREVRSEQRPPREPRPQRAPLYGFSSDTPLVPYRIEVGRNLGASPKEIVGAIANEGGIEGRFIGQINLYDDFSTVELPANIPTELFSNIKQIRVRQTPLSISQIDPSTLPAPAHPARNHSPAPEGERPFYPKRRNNSGKAPFNRNRPNRNPDSIGSSPQGEHKPRQHVQRHRRPPRERTPDDGSSGLE